MTDARFAAASIALGLACLARIAGQAAQRWWGWGFLPSQDAWQGWVRPVAWFGAAYFAVMAARLAIGLGGDAGVFGDDSFAAKKWFTAYSAASFHLVLAAEVMLFAAYQRRRSRLDR